MNDKCIHRWHIQGNGYHDKQEAICLKCGALKTFPSLEEQLKYIEAREFISGYNIGYSKRGAKALLKIRQLKTSIV